MKKPTIIIFSLLVTIAALSVARAIVLNSISTSGIALDKTQEELANYKTQNAILKEKLLSVTSLDYISSNASLMGFVENKTSISLNKPLPLAIRQ